ncbi:MAG: translation elongation factor Ts [Chloroflexota bacterium]|nr:translation elongation factor Ts [Chloroflexota bacterium]MDE2910839.1 translation elongation factor Ts [Chloroflexota bacterium]
MSTEPKQPMAVTAKEVKALRDKTGAGPLDCKKALEQHHGDMDAAAEYLREKALKDGIKLQGKGRRADEGVIGNYLHFDNRLAVIVEVNCETDFVAATDQFKAFAKDIAMHIANMSPKYVKREDVPDDVVAAETRLQLERALEEGKPEHIAEKIVAGRMNKWYEDIVLMEQSFIKDDDKTVGQYLQETVAEVGETINIGRYQRFAIGGEG